MSWINFPLVNWLSSVSPLSLACLVLLSSQVGFLIFGLKKLKSLRNLSLMKRKSLSASSTNSDSTEDSLESNGSLNLPSTPRVVAALMVALVSAVLLFMAASKQRGYCVASGDFAHSDNMTVLYQMEPNMWKVKGKDGSDYNFRVCPTTPMKMDTGLIIEYADYEYRDGCSDFTSPLAKLKFK